jgi:opacity protein-like surface antigen
MLARRLLSALLVVTLCLLLAVPFPSTAQEFRIDAGGGWAIPTNEVEAESASNANVRPLSIDLNSGPHLYVGLGFVRSIGENFDLGARVRGHTSRIRSSVGVCDSGACENPDGDLRAATVEGRVILTSPGWIHPYLLVGLGVVHTSVDGVTVQTDQGTFEFAETTVTDAGGDVGLGASIPLGSGFMLDGEFRVTGALPGGKDNAVTMLPFSLGLAYQVR